VITARARVCVCARARARVPFNFVTIERFYEIWYKRYAVRDRPIVVLLTDFV